MKSTITSQFAHMKRSVEWLLEHKAITKADWMMAVDSTRTCQDYAAPHASVSDTADTDAGENAGHQTSGTTLDRMESRAEHSGSVSSAAPDLIAAFADSLTLLSGWINRYCHPRYKAEHLADVARKRAILDAALQPSEQREGHKQ